MSNFNDKHMKKIFIINVLLIALTACDQDFEEINTNPNDPSVVATADLMAGAQRSLVRSLFGMYDNWGIAYIPQVYMQYWAATLYTNVDRYETITLDFTDFYVESLNDFNEVIKLNTNEASMIEAAKYGPHENQIAVARIMKAYTFHNLTDIWGAIPYSESLQGSAD